MASTASVFGLANKGSCVNTVSVECISARPVNFSDACALAIHTHDYQRTVYLVGHRLTGLRSEDLIPLYVVSFLNDDPLTNEWLHVSFQFVEWVPHIICRLSAGQVNQCLILCYTKHELLLRFFYDFRVRPRADYK